MKLIWDIALQDWEDLLAEQHFLVEGQIEYHASLFVPRRAPHYLNESQKRNNIKLFVRREVFLDERDALMSEWLNMVKGAIDSEYLPPHILRETLTQHKIPRVIKKNLVKKCLEMLTEIAETDDHMKFWEQLGRCT